MAHHGGMSWIKRKPVVTDVPPISVSGHMARHHRRYQQPHVDAETEARLADFLIKHGRLEPRRGRPLLQLLGTLRNGDDTIDYSVRTVVRLANGATQRFDSHIREYPDGTKRMRLIR